MGHTAEKGGDSPAGGETEKKMADEENENVSTADQQNSVAKAAVSFPKIADVKAEANRQVYFWVGILATFIFIIIIIILST